jgi:tetratricopeptide (TPR) repeat protein
MRPFLSISLAFTLTLSLGAKADDGHSQLIEGMAGHHHEITTDSQAAQKLFDQGLTLAFGFNHEEAADSFRAAIEADGQCAMCHWGLAFVLGPNINASMEAANHAEAWAAIERASELAPRASERERAYVQAMARRYSPEHTDERAHLDKAWADAMRRLALRYPDDLDAATLFAEALMDTMPWDYWTTDGDAKPATREFIDALEKVLKQQPDHLGANHFLIHAVEKVRPDLGEPAADRLGALDDHAPGHLIHMASHIYIRVGRYADAARVNERAIDADEAYDATHGAHAAYEAGYMPHNRHFLSAAAGFQGRSAVALEQARIIADRVDRKLMHDPAMAGSLQHYYLTPHYTMVRFGRWEEILDEPPPPADLAYPTGIWHFARGLAHLRGGEIEPAAAELTALRRQAASPSLEGVAIWNINTPKAVLALAVEVLGGEIASARGRHDEAIAALERAAALEEALIYDEPPTWNIPVRQYLGQALLAAGKADESRLTYEQDLAKYPRNGWSLIGLAKSLEELGRGAEATKARKAFEKAWREADVEIEASRF